MQRTPFVFLVSVMLSLFTLSCGNTAEVKSEPVAAETVEPEIGPAQQAGAEVDAMADSVEQEVKQGKAEVREAIDTAQKDLKSTSEKIKTETNKAAAEVKKAAVEASETIKKETNKAADKVKKAAKDVKEDLKK